MNEPMITIRLPLSHWNQIEDDIENMCGLPAREIEILQRVEVVSTSEVDGDGER